MYEAAFQIDICFYLTRINLLIDVNLNWVFCNDIDLITASKCIVLNVDLY